MSNLRRYRPGSFTSAQLEQQILELLRDRREGRPRMPDTVKKGRHSLHDQRISENDVVFDLEETSEDKLPIIPINQYLKCPICLDFAVTPVYSCERGHIVCGICYDKAKQCSTCNNDLTYNGLVERILRLEGVTFPCRNSQFGCKQKIKPSEMKTHLTTCDFRLIRCQEVMTNSCTKMAYNPQELFEHWKVYHKIAELPVISSNVKDGLCTVSQLMVAFLDKTEYRWRISYFEYDSRTFFLHIVCQNSLIYIWVTCLDTETEAKRYKFSFSLLGSADKGAQITWNKFPVHCLQYYKLDRAKDSGHVGVLHSKTLKMLRRDGLVTHLRPTAEDNFTWWTLRIDLFK